MGLSLLTLCLLYLCVTLLILVALLFNSFRQLVRHQTHAKAALAALEKSLGQQNVLPIDPPLSGPDVPLQALQELRMFEERYAACLRVVQSYNRALGRWPGICFVRCTRRFSPLAEPAAHDASVPSPPVTCTYPHSDC